MTHDPSLVEGLAERIYAGRLAVGEESAWARMSHLSKEIYRPQASWILDWLIPRMEQR